MSYKITGTLHEDICIFMTVLVSNYTMVVSLRLPATIFVMVSNVIIDFIIIVITLVSGLPLFIGLCGYTKLRKCFA
jgi:hypothetical protein